MVGYLNTYASKKMSQQKRSKRDKELIEDATKGNLEKWAKRKSETILSLEDQEADLDDSLDSELERAL
uniref:DUF3340 domain-containing protein n=1 Tax=Rhabditophanes sp. KR3021 TaxID=114890 RepID=A0AC35U9N1_9BILA